MVSRISIEFKYEQEFYRGVLVPELLQDKLHRCLSRSSQGTDKCDLCWAYDQNDLQCDFRMNIEGCLYASPKNPEKCQLCQKKTPLLTKGKDEFGTCPRLDGKTCPEGCDYCTIDSDNNEKCLICSKNWWKDASASHKCTNVVNSGKFFVPNCINHYLKSHLTILDQRCYLCEEGYSVNQFGLCDPVTKRMLGCREMNGISQDICKECKGGWHQSDIGNRECRMNHSK
jgi:hypothetical protein